jgi:hypothetical protein
MRHAEWRSMVGIVVLATLVAGAFDWVQGDSPERR